MVSDGGDDPRDVAEACDSLNSTQPWLGRRLRLICNGEYIFLFGKEVSAKACMLQLFGVGEVVAISLGVNNGVGRRAVHLDVAQINSVEKV